MKSKDNKGNMKEIKKVGRKDIGNDEKLNSKQ